MSGHCGFCSKSEISLPYVCPRCSVVYCSLKCYRDPRHSSCSEGFYKECVEEELLSMKTDSDTRKRTLEMLNRLRVADEEETSLDSDDDEDLDERLEGADFDDSKDLWSRLTREEKKDFQKLIDSGKIEEFIPAYTPWWRKSKKLICEVDEDESPYPKIDIDISALPEDKFVSPHMKYSLLNLIYGYAYALQFYYGDYESSSGEFASCVLHLSEALVQGGNPLTSVDSALESAASRVNPAYSVSREMTRGTKREAIIIAKDFALNALSDLKRAFYVAIRNDSSSKEMTKSLKLVCKKVEFYISWAKTHWNPDFLTL